MQLFLISFILVVFMYKYILRLLILIEILVINISLILYIIYGFFNIEYYVLYYLVFRVCERVLGLGILVIIIRFYGSELYYIINIRKF